MEYRRLTPFFFDRFITSYINWGLMFTFLAGTIPKFRMGMMMVMIPISYVNIGMRKIRAQNANANQMK